MKAMVRDRVGRLDRLYPHLIGCRVVIEEPWYRESGFLADVEHPTFGSHARLAPLVALGLTPGAAGPAPVLGQHTEAVLRELGYDDAAIDALATRRIVRRTTDPA